MRHRRRGRKLGRNPKHQRALLRSLSCALILTKYNDEVSYSENFDMQVRQLGMSDTLPRVPGRIITTVSKAKEVRPYVEKCISIAKKGLLAEEAARQHATDAERGTDAWRKWRDSESWSKWNQAMAPALAARRRCLQLLGDKLAVSILFAEVAPMFEGRDGGYTRIVKLAQPRLGDAGPRAILEFVGVRDRVVQKAERPTFDDTEDETQEEATTEEEASDETAEAESTEEATAEADQEEKS